MQQQPPYLFGVVALVALVAGVAIACHCAKEAPASNPHTGKRQQAPPALHLGAGAASILQERPPDHASSSTDDAKEEEEEEEDQDDVWLLRGEAADSEETSSRYRELKRPLEMEKEIEARLKDNRRHHDPSSHPDRVVALHKYLSRDISRFPITDSNMRLDALLPGGNNMLDPSHGPSL